MTKKEVEIESSVEREASITLTRCGDIYGDSPISRIARLFRYSIHSFHRDEVVSERNEGHQCDISFCSTLCDCYHCPDCCIRNIISQV